MAVHLISPDDAERDLLECAAYLAEAVKSADGRAGAISAVVPRYLARGEVDLAAELANTITDPFTRDRLLMLVAEKCAELDDDEYALQLADAIEELGLQSQARERVALQKAAKGNFEKAVEIASTMEHPDQVLAGVAVQKAAAGDDSGALAALDAVEFWGARVSALHSIAAAKIEGGDSEAAADLLQQSVAAAGEIEHNEEKIRALSDTGNLFVAANGNDKAIETFEKARGHAETLDNVHRDRFLGSIALGFLRAGSLGLADRTLDLVTDKTQMATALLGYAREFWRKDEKDEALEALEESYAILRSQRDIETRDSKAKFALFSAIAVQFAGFEKGERGIEIAQSIIDENEQMSALAQIAQILTIQKNETLAPQAISAILEDANRVFALIGVSDIHNKNGEREKAVATLDEAADLAETVPQLASRSAAYNEIAKRLIGYGETVQAGEVLKTSLETITAIRDKSSQAVSLAEFADVRETLGQPYANHEISVIQDLVRKAEF